MTSADAIAARFVRNATDNQLVIGPVLTRDDVPGPYFIAAGTDAHGFWCEQVVLTDCEDRSEVLMALVAGAKAILFHVLEDELQMAELCHALWPCAKTERILVGERAEREAATATKH